MSPEFVQKLYEDFPLLFPRTIAIEVDDGWYNILYAACTRIQKQIDNREKSIAFALEWNEAVDSEDLEWNRFGPREKRVVPEIVPQVVISNIKEKFGSLRISHTGGNDFTDGIIIMAEEMSHVTCEECGSPGQATKKGWIRVLCEEHMEAKELKEQTT